MNIQVYRFDLPLKHEFTISRESTTVQPTLIVELEDGPLRGYGEATTNSYYEQSEERMMEAFERVAEQLPSISWEEPSELWRKLDPQLTENRFAQCALDQAAHDLWGKKLQQPVWKLWDLDPATGIPLSNYTLGIDDIPVMIEKMREFPDWPIYKIKLGTDHDLEIVRAIRAETDATFRVDANCGWTPEYTLEIAPQLKQLGVEFIEQPLPADDFDGMAQIASACPLPIIADESCLLVADVGDCFHTGFNGINIKLPKCGGLTPARQMIKVARQLGLQVMVGCMTESTVGISAIAQLLPLIDYVDMDGAVLLAADIATGVKLDRGRCVYPDVPGHGIELTGQGERLL